MARKSECSGLSAVANAVVIEARDRVDEVLSCLDADIEAYKARRLPEVVEAFSVLDEGDGITLAAAQPMLDGVIAEMGAIYARALAPFEAAEKALRALLRRAHLRGDRAAIAAHISRINKAMASVRPDIRDRLETTKASILETFCRFLDREAAFANLITEALET